MQHSARHASHEETFVTLPEAAATPLVSMLCVALLFAQVIAVHMYEMTGSGGGLGVVVGGSGGGEEVVVTSVCVHVLYVCALDKKISARANENIYL